MTSDRFRECLEILQLSQRAFGRLTGWGERASRAWAQGKYAIPVPIAEWLEEYMDWIEKHPVPQKGNSI